MNNMFGNIDWEKQQKGVDEVKQGIGKWDISKITSFDNMFENVTVVDEKIIPQTQIMAKGLINEFLKLKKNSDTRTIQPRIRNL